MYIFCQQNCLGTQTRNLYTCIINSKFQGDVRIKMHCLWRKDIFPMHTDLEIHVSSVENLAVSNVLHLRPGVGQNVAMHASPIAIKDKLQSLCPLSLCPNYCLYAVTVGVADGGVVDAINILCLSLASFFLSAHLYFLLR